MTAESVRPRNHARGVASSGRLLGDGRGAPSPTRILPRSTLKSAIRLQGGRKKTEAGEVRDPAALVTDAERRPPRSRAPECRPALSNLAKFHSVSGPNMTRAEPPYRRAWQSTRESRGEKSKEEQEGIKRAKGEKKKIDIAVLRR